MKAPVDPNSTAMTDIHDIKPALAFEGPWPWWVWVIAVAVIAALAALFWWWRKKRQHQDASVSATPVMPPDMEAIQQLDRLAASGDDNPKRFYFRLSAILRHYVERRYNFPAAEMTTEELLPQIRQQRVAADLTQQLAAFCRASDPIKFADATTDHTRMGQDLAFVRLFVQKTTMKEMPESHMDSESIGKGPGPPPKRLADEQPSAEKTL